MKFPTFARSKAASPPTVDANHVSTLSNDSSQSDLEKRNVVRTDSTSSRERQPGEKKLETALDEAAALDKPSDEIVYPRGSKLAIITASLCVSVFCMALVWVANAVMKISDG